VSNGKINSKGHGNYAQKQNSNLIYSFTTKFWKEFGILMCRVFLEHLTVIPLVKEVPAFIDP
jgi:hypothetical protein